MRKRYANYDEPDLPLDPRLTNAKGRDALRLMIATIGKMVVPDDVMKAEGIDAPSGSTVADLDLLKPSQMVLDALDAAAEGYEGPFRAMLKDYANEVAAGFSRPPSLIRKIVASQ